MKKIIIALIALFPLIATAQNVWEKPVDQSQQQTKKKKALIEKDAANEDPKYLVGAIPMVDGKIVFTLDYDVPGKSAQQINLRFLLQKGIMPIPKAASEAHIRDNQDVFDFSLAL